MTFPEKLRSERERLGITQASAAIVLGVSKSVIEKWENGSRAPLEITLEGAIARLEKLIPPGTAASAPPSQSR